MEQATSVFEIQATLGFPVLVEAILKERDNDDKFCGVKNATMNKEPPICKCHSFELSGVTRGKNLANISDFFKGNADSFRVYHALR